MTLKEIIKELRPTIKKIKAEIEETKENKKFNESKFNLIIASKLKTVLGDPIKNPIMKIDDATEYYFLSEKCIEHIQEKYMLIINLQDYITQELSIPFIYEKYTVLKILQLTLNTYNEFLDECKTGVNARNEDVANLFIDIETMLFSDRNASAENYTKNAKAIDITNRYDKKVGGYGAVFEKDNKPPQKEVLLISPEESERRLKDFNFSALMVEESTKKKEK